MTCYDKISFSPQSLLWVLHRYLYAARIYTVDHNPPDLWSIIVRLIQSLRVISQVIDILDWLGGGKSFAKLDLANGYWQVPVREEDREKTAVVTHCGLFEFISMPFGLKMAGATFQRLMQATFSDLLMRT